MPTVKLTGGKVVLKSGKVACSCCTPPESCCMYPASGVGVDYTEDDLPDSINVTLDGGTLECFRDGSTFTSTDTYDPPGSAAARYFRVILEERDGGYGWSTQVSINGTTRSLPGGFQPCLITGDGNLTPGDDTVEDQFEAEYTLANLAPAAAPDATVTRVSLCVWEGVTTDDDGEEYPLFLFYGLPPVSGTYPSLGAPPAPDMLWFVAYVYAGDGFIYPKTGDQNGPVGTYDVGTVAEV